MAKEIVSTVQINTKEAQHSTKSLKQQIKELKDQLNQTTQGTKEYNEILQQVGEKQRILTENTERVKEASTDFSNNIQYAGQALAGMAGAVSTVTGVMSLMGVEADKDSKLMKAMVGAMSITTGITAMQNGYTAIRKLTQGIKMATVASGGLGKAMKALAMSNPFTAILTAVLATVTAVVALTKALDKGVDKAKKMADETTRMLSAIDGNKSAQDFAYNMAEAYGATADQLHNIRLEQAKLNLEQKQAVKDKATSDYLSAKTKKEAKELKEALDIAITAEQEAYEVYDKVVKEGLVNYAKQVTLQKKAAEESAKARRKELEDAKASQYELDKNAIEIRKLSDAKYTDLRYTQDLLAIEEEHIKTMKAGNKDYIAQEKVIAQLTKKISDLVNVEAESAKAISEGLKPSIDIEIQELTDKYNVEKTLLEKYGYDTVKLTEKYEKEVNEIKTRYARETNTATFDKYLLSQDIEYYERKKRIYESGEKDLTKYLAELEQQEFTNRFNALNEQYRLELISDEKFQIEKTKLEAEFAEKRRKQEEEEAQKKRQINQNYYDGLQSITSSISSILSSVGDTLEQGTKEYKALKVSQAIIDTISGGVSAFVGMIEQIKGPAGIVAGSIASASVLAQGYASVRQIMSTQVSKSAMPSYTPNNITVQSLTNSPTNVRQMTTSNDYDEINTRQQKLKVYVVASEVEEMNEQTKAIVTQNKF